jgi:anaerobic magnesium-protoporphyrin IX monomethyl ester cyclase
VNPAPSGAYRFFDFTMAPLGVLAVAAYAERAGFRLAVDDRAVARHDEPFAPAGYDVVGIHCDSSRHHRALALAREAKAAGAVVVLGGPHPTYVEAELLGTGVVDVIVRGEGERSFAALLGALRDGTPLDAVRGITFVWDGEIVRTPDEPVLDDLDALPFPARHLVDMTRYRGATMEGRPIANVHTSRGCPYKCSFCSSSWFDGVKWRARAPRDIVDEVEELGMRWGYQAVAFMDDLFTMDARRVVGVAEEILRRGLDVYWWCFTRADTLVRNERMVELMAASGCKRVFIGVESATEAVLLDYNKKLQLDMPRRAIALARRHGIGVTASYILGDLRETRDDVLRTIRYAKTLDSDTAQFSILTPYPGTALWEQVQDRIVDRNWAHYTGQRAVMALPHLGPTRLHLLMARAYLAFYFRSWRSTAGFFRFLRGRRFGLSALSERARARQCA